MSFAIYMHLPRIRRCRHADRYRRCWRSDSGQDDCKIECSITPTARPGGKKTRPADLLRALSKNNSGKIYLPFILPAGFYFNYTELNLCDIHFHVNAEHKAKDFSIYAGDGVNGLGGGYKCNDSTSLKNSELQEPTTNFCKDVKPGDTIEVHWVYTSCEVKPGKGLGSCFSDSCINPNLRVEAQIFAVVNDSSALNFLDFVYGGDIVNGYHQAKALPTNTGTPVAYAGSTTGSVYTEQKCSPFQGTWSVRPKCAKIDITSLSEWCKNNVFEENHAHGVRKLVTNPKLLEEIK